MPRDVGAGERKDEEAVSHTFKVGDRAIVVHSAHAPETIGEVVTLVRLSDYKPGYDAPYPLEAGHQLWVVNRPSRTPGHVCAYPPEWLEPLPDDGHERGEWTPELLKLCKAGRVTA